MNPIETDPQTGRRYQVGPDGVSRWVDEQPAPPPPRLGSSALGATRPFGPASEPERPAAGPERPAAGPARRRSRWIAALVVVAVFGVVLIGVAIWAWPTAAGCESQMDAEVVTALQSKDLTDFEPNTDQSHYWRCFGQSDEAMQEIAARVVAKHAGELIQKGLSDLLN